MNERIKKKILKGIKEKSEPQDECIIWKGSYRHNTCFIYYTSNGKTQDISVIKFLYRHYHPENQIKPTEKLVRSCANPKCVKIEHLHIEPKAQPMTKQRVWNRMKKHSKLNDNKKFNGVSCREWATKTKSRYIQISIKGKNYLAHIVSYWVHNDEYENIEDIPKIDEEGNALQMTHKCNNPRCFEPTHIELDTRYKNNYEDKIAAGTLTRGEKNARCTINKELAQKIKLSRLDKGDENYKTGKERAKEFGVSLSIVQHIDAGKNWGHLPDKSGNTSSNRTYKRKYIKTAKERIWTTEDFEKAQKYLESKSEVDNDHAEFKGTKCLRWIGYTHHNYGQAYSNGREFPAHVLAYCVANKTLERNGLQVAHSCGYSLCINADHLRLDTPAGNGADKVLHNTSRRKLDMATANKIRSLYKTKKYTHADLGKKFGVNNNLIGRIITNKAYTDNPKTTNSGSETAASKKAIAKPIPKYSDSKTAIPTIIAKPKLSVSKPATKKVTTKAKQFDSKTEIPKSKPIKKRPIFKTTNSTPAYKITKSKK